MDVGCSGVRWSGRVEGLATAARLDVEHPAGLDEGGQVGDRVPHPVAAAGPLEVHGLVEVHRAGRVEGEERQVAQVAVRQPRRADRAVGGRARPRAGSSSGSASSSRMPLEHVVQRRRGPGGAAQP